MLYKDAASPAEVTGDGGKVAGYASTFDREPDSYGDVNETRWLWNRSI